MRPDFRRRELRRPVPLALALTLAGQLLFAVRVHYVPAARALLALSGPRNVEHPLLGKALIALSMRVFGDDALGWRALSTVAGAAAVGGTVAIQSSP